MSPDPATPDTPSLTPDQIGDPRKPTHDLERWAPWDGLSDEHGPIPAFGPAKTDKQGRVVMSREEREARRDAAIRMLQVIGDITDETDTDELWDEVMKAIQRDR